MKKKPQPMSTGKKIVWAVLLSVLVGMIGVVVYAFISLDMNSDSLRDHHERSRQLNRR